MSVFYITSNEEQAQAWDWEYLALLWSLPLRITGKSYLHCGWIALGDGSYLCLPNCRGAATLTTRAVSTLQHMNDTEFGSSRSIPRRRRGVIEAHMMRWKDIHGEYYKRVREWLRQEEKFLPPIAG